MVSKWKVHENFIKFFVDVLLYYCVTEISSIEDVYFSTSLSRQEKTEKMDETVSLQICASSCVEKKIETNLYHKNST